MRSKKRGGHCCYCKRGPLLASTDRSNMAFTFDHIVPRVHGGWRRVPCCRLCNGLKGSLSPREWFWFIDNHPEYWRTFKTHEAISRVIAAERVRRVRDGEPPLSTLPMGHHLANFNGEAIHG